MIAPGIALRYIRLGNTEMTTGKSEQEEEYIMREEMTRLRESAKKREAELEAEEREQQKQAHWMRCAKCGAELKEVVFRGVKIDKCFACGGVYLDDGELEQLVGKPTWFDAFSEMFKGS